MRERRAGAGLLIASEGPSTRLSAFSALAVCSGGIYIACSLSLRVAIVFSLGRDAMEKRLPSPPPIVQLQGADHKRAGTTTNTGVLHRCTAAVVSGIWPRHLFPASHVLLSDSPHSVDALASRREKSISSLDTRA